MAMISFTVAEARLLSHSLNSCKVSQFNQKQLEALPTIGRKLANFLLDNEHKKPRKSQNPPFYNEERANKTGVFTVLRDTDI
ncbi:hypothetical protein [Hymenobacter rigui]|uniref:hypothetical protein n=1 Tax=Hymenobacter rigui TaxID=334424 RepID=UPI000F68E261|nr:hypothetical protein [Hymenobacter rigui]